jgi:hypothetical protein
MSDVTDKDIIQAMQLLGRLGLAEGRKVTEKHTIWVKAQAWCILDNADKSSAFSEAFCDRVRALAAELKQQRETP